MKEKPVTRAEKIARKAHEGQLRRGGQPYIAHIERVVQSLEGEDQDVLDTAWLHDVIEDTPHTKESLINEGIHRHIINAVVAMTHDKHQPYDEYILQVRANPMSRIVKIADIIDNLSDNPTDRQTEKYKKAVAVLL